jgi:catalase
VADPYALAEDLLEAIAGIFGEQGKHRAVHAKGTLLSGTFTPSAGASELSHAPHLAGGYPVRVTARFSNGGGNPAAPDADPDGRGIGVKLYLPDGSVTDMVGLSLPCFFVRTPEEFLEFTRARKPDPETGQPDMEVLGAFLGAHPEAGPAIQAAVTAGVPAGYDRIAYNSIHSFRYVDGAGNGRFGRWRMIPEAGEATVEPEAVPDLAPDFLQEEVQAHAASGGVAFRVIVRLAADGDDVDDPTVAWPEGEREEVELGRLELTGPETERETGGDVLVFDPTRVTDGIEVSGDKILAARPRAYSVSVERRTGAPRPPL